MAILKFWEDLTTQTLEDAILWYNYFIIKRSNDTYDWGIIGTVKGSGNRNHPKMYNYIDNEPYNGYNYYFLYVNLKITSFRLS